MANLRDIRRRIKSIKNTAQITKAMQMVAEAKMRRAQHAAISIRPYIEELDRIAEHLYASLGTSDFRHPLLNPPPAGGKTAVLVVTSDKGLCGALNANLMREVLRQDDPDKVYIALGRKGRQALVRARKNLLADFTLKDSPTFAESKVVSRFLIEKFEAGEFASVQVYYSHFVNSLVQAPICASLVPIGSTNLAAARSKGEARQETEEKREEDFRPLAYTFEPEPEILLGKLLPHYIHVEVYQKILDARASEHSARRVAMKNATDNAKDLIKDLTLSYNKARQAAITNEILEIASAANSMN